MEVGKPFNPYMMFIGCIIPNVIMKSKTLTSTAKLCYGRLLQFAGVNGKCFPSIERLAQEIGVELRQAQNILRNLEDVGLIKRVPRLRDNGSQTSNEFVFLWHKSFAETSESSENIECSEIHGGECSPLHEGRCNQVHPNEENQLLRESEMKKDNPIGLSVLPSGKTINMKPLLLRRVSGQPVWEKEREHKYRKDVLQVVSYWNSSPGLPHHRVPGNGSATTKSILKISKIIGEVIDGKFSKEWPPYGVEVIIKAIDNFKTRVTNTDYAPTNKEPLKSINLLTFFHNPFSDSIPSWFKECISNPPTLLKNTVPRREDKNPTLTKWLQKLYVDKVLLGQNRNFNQVEINKFIQGSNFLGETMQGLRERANLLTGPYEFCEYTIEALLKQFPRRDIKLGNVASEWTYTELLPRYLQEIGRIN